MLVDQLPKNFLTENLYYTSSIKYGMAFYYQILLPNVGGITGISSIVAIFYGNFTASIGLTLSILILHLGWQRRK